MILSEKNYSHKRYSRIVSLVPSQTELLAYLGLEKEVIGITKFCVHPTKWFREKRKVGGTKNIQLEKIEELSPDLILGNKEENRREQIEELAKKFDVWITDVNSLEDAIQMINDLGNLCGRRDRANSLALKIKEDFEKLNEMISHKEKKRAVFFIWKDPWMVVGANTFINDILKYAALENVFAHLERYPQIHLNDIPSNTDLILLSSEPYPFKEKHKVEIENLFKGIKVEIVDGEMFSWYGSRLLKSIDYFHFFLKNEHKYLI